MTEKYKNHWFTGLFKTQAQNQQQTLNRFWKPYNYSTAVCQACFGTFPKKILAKKKLLRE